MNEAALELVFMMVILKLPIVYMCAVIWWAVRAVPDPLEGAPLQTGAGSPRCPWRPPRPRAGGPRSGSVRARRARRARAIV